MPIREIQSAVHEIERFAKKDDDTGRLLHMVKAALTAIDKEIDSIKEVTEKSVTY